MMPAGYHSNDYLGPLDPRCPFRLGDRVQLHGYAGSPPGQQRTGFRGEVVGGFGTRQVQVLSDNGTGAANSVHGRIYVENWAWLTREGDRDKSAVDCVCCPPLVRNHKERKKARRQTAAIAQFEESADALYRSWHPDKERPAPSTVDGVA